MLDASKTSQDFIADEVLGNIVAELMRRRPFGGSSEERMQLVLEVMWNKVEYTLKYSRKMACQLEDYPNSKVMQSVLNGRTFKYHFWEGRFHMFLSLKKVLMAFD